MPEQLKFCALAKSAQQGELGKHVASVVVGAMQVKAATEPMSGIEKTV
jgi:hypothetical protein